MKLFEPVKMRNLTVKNRLFRSATWDGLANPDGTLPYDLYKIYERVAAGGVGTIFTALTDVCPYDWATCGNMRLCSDLLIPDYRRLTDVVHRYDCKILPQLNINEYTRAEKRPRQVSVDQMTKADIQECISLFVAAAVRAKAAGFDGVQLHLAYGWLLNRSVDPMWNHRTDEYGGNTRNRCRLTTDIIAAIRSEIPDYHISAKFSFFDHAEGGFAVQECVEICRMLAEAGLDSIEILGGHSPMEYGVTHRSCYLDLAKAAKQAVDIPVILTGNNHDPLLMERILNEEGIPFFALSRPLIREPKLPQRWASGDMSAAKCISCGRCYTTYGKRCIFNPDL